jgi:SAM-dependent methyltransferase
MPMSLKPIAKTIVLAPARLVPLSLGSAVCKWWCKSLEKRGQDRSALRHLFELEELLDLAVNERAIVYDHGVHVKHRLTGYHDFFAQRIKPGEIVADIGCGIDALANSIAQKSGEMVTAIDLNQASLATAREKCSHANITFLHQDALAWQPTQTFETIVLSNVLEHIEDRTAFLQTTQANLQPQRWLIHVPRFDRNWRLPLKAEMGLFAYGDPTHFIEYTPELFAKEMDQAGLYIEHIESRWSDFWAQVRAR